MTLRGLDNWTNQTLGTGSESVAATSDESGWRPTASELEPGFASIDPQGYAATEVWGSDESEVAIGCAGSDHNDTIPSPPPELDSAPFQLEF
jgi:hypothetical protein